MTAHHQVHLLGELGEESRFLDGGVAATDDGDLMATEEEAVARGTGRQTVADEPLLALESEHQALRAGADDHRIGGVLLLADPHPEGPGREVDTGDLLGEELGTETGRLLAHAHHQLGTHDSLGEAGEVLDLGGQHQLSAGLVARAARLALDDERGEAGAGGVDRRGEAGRAGTDDEDVMVTHAGSFRWRILSMTTPRT
ncbi:MAG: hypothetical protein RJB65_2249 [Actinomycetota bacterium]